MAMALEAALWIARMAWVALSGWISSCLTVADEFASSLRSGDIGPFHVGLEGEDAFVVWDWISLNSGTERLLLQGCLLYLVDCLVAYFV
ncbi:hypothetical protein Fmac_029653 [Flemingia macrophylla]|uniref:Secreted protein n=1 Tax=Flemingia macrophylla TaxID=520843 RepID=A0ABD1LAY3_9FABA